MKEVSLKIGAIGWWNYDNEGDRAMLAALRQGLAPHHVVAIDIGFPANPDTVYRLNRLDYILLGGGTLIPGRPASPFDTFHQWNDQLECPLSVVGLGVDAVEAPYWLAVEALLDRAELFYVRDQASRVLLGDHPKVQVAPDLSFAFPLPACQEATSYDQRSVRCGVNIRQSPRLDPEPWLHVLARLPVTIRAIPLSSFDLFGEDMLLTRLDPRCPARFDASLYREIDIMVGVAFHSVLFAVQAAVPVIAIDYAPKVRHFMEDIGLARYLLAPDQHARLPELVTDVLAHHAAISAEVRAISSTLHQAARENMACVRRQIEQSGPRHQRTGPRVSIVVIGGADAEKDQRTLASCEAQTYENTAVTQISAASQAALNRRLKQTLAQSDGEYLTWVDGGDWFADDAIEFLVSRMEQQPHLGVGYTDYYVMNSMNLPQGHHTVPGSDKLYRRDVVGPHFLMRRSLLAELQEVPDDSPLLAYSLWLQVSGRSVLAPFHAPLLYSTRAIRSRTLAVQEREVRRLWRQDRPWWVRWLWQSVDSDWFERLVVQPVLRLFGLLKQRGRDVGR